MTDRLKLRRRALLWSAPVVIAVLLIAVRLLSLAPINSSGQSMIDDDEPGKAADRFGLLGPLNPVEKWIQPFNVGVARYAEEDFTSAEAEFRVALDRSPGGADECRTLHNLVISIEAQGDVASEDREVADARELWTEALELAIDGDCIERDDEVGERLVEDEERLREKLNPDEQDPDDGGDDGGDGNDPPPEPPPPNQPDPDTEMSLEQLNQRTSDALEQQRQDAANERLETDYSDEDRW